MLTSDGVRADTHNQRHEVLDNTMHEATLCAVEVDDESEIFVQITLELNTDLEYFCGHFPSHPILPGIVQSGWAIMYGARYLGLPVHVIRLEVLKFRKVIQPGCKLVLSLQVKPNGKLVFQYTCDGDIMSSGRIVYRDHVMECT